MVNFMKNFINAELENFYAMDQDKRTTGFKVVKKIFTGGGSRDADNVLTKEHIDIINKDIELLWKLPLEKGISEKVKNQAAKTIPELLSNEMCSEKTKERYIDMAKKGIKSGDQIYNHLTFIKTFLLNSQHKYGEIRKINDKYDIFGIILTAGEAYLGRVSKLFTQPYDFNHLKWIEKYLREKDPALMAGHTHSDHIEKMFEIIQYLIERADSDKVCENADLERMFAVFVGKRISNKESEMLFDLVSGQIKNSRGLNTDEYIIKDKKIRKFIFQTCLCKKDYVTPHDYSPKSIRCFKDLFLTVNESDRRLILDEECAVIQTVKILDLEGLDTLWNIATQTSNPKVQERAGYLLAVIYYLYMDKRNDKDWGRETNSIVKYLMDTLNAKTADEYERANHAKVINQFIDVFEDIHSPEHFRLFYKKLYEIEDEDEEELMDSQFYSFYNYKWNKQRTAVFKVIRKELGTEDLVEVELKESVTDLKHKIAKIFNVKPREFEIMYGSKGNTYLEPQNDWLYIYQLIRKIEARPDPSIPINIAYDAYEMVHFKERSITYSIVEEQEYLEILCEYLKKADIVTSLQTINIIERLPILSDHLFDLKKYIETHKIEKYGHWYTVLKVKFDQPEELFMKMKLLENLLYPDEFYNIDLRDEFIRNNGINFLIDIVVQACTVLISQKHNDKFPL